MRNTYTNGLRRIKIHNTSLWYQVTHCQFKS